MTTHYLGLKSSDSPELAGADFTEDVDFEGNYSLQLQNIPDLVSREPSYWFDGVDDYVSLEIDTNLIPGTNPFSLISVVNVSELLLQSVVGGASSSFGLRISATGKLAVTKTGVNEITSSTSTLLPNVNNYIAYCRDGSDDANYYINGKAAGAVTDANDYSVATTYIGKTVAGAELEGQISRILLFNLALSAAEVKALSSGGEIPYKYRGASQTALTTGTLTIGKHYTIDTYVATDDFTNVGGVNTSGTSFVATGASPTDWSNGSSLRQTGCVLNLNPSGIGKNQWIDQSGNNLHGSVSGAIPTNLPTNHIEKIILKSKSSDQTFTLPAGYKISSAVIEETAGDDSTAYIGIGVLGDEIVNGDYINASSITKCTIINSNALQSTSADTTITISSDDWGSSVWDIYIEAIRMIA